MPDRGSRNGHTIVPLFDHHPAIGETSRPQFESLIGKAGLELDRSGRGIDHVVDCLHSAAIKQGFAVFRIGINRQFV